MEEKLKVDTSVIPSGSTPLIESKNGTEINLYTLKALISKYNIDGGILKMDWEGCEYALLYEDNETIRSFNQIEIEYHMGYERLISKLKECGFRINFTKPIRYYDQKARGQWFKG